jgi:hypothetical protein
MLMITPYKQYLPASAQWGGEARSWLMCDVTRCMRTSQGVADGTTMLRACSPRNTAAFEQLTTRMVLPEGAKHIKATVSDVQHAVLACCATHAMTAFHCSAMTAGSA